MQATTIINTTRATTDTPRIYVACLAAYNSGVLHGAWIDATNDAWRIWDGIAAMLVASPIAGAEEWAIHDYEGFGCIRIAEYEGIERVAEIVAFIEEHGALGAAVVDHYSGDLAEAREALEDRYLGTYASLADYMQEITEEMKELPHSLRYYIDYHAMAHDAEMSGDLFAIEIGYEQAHIFAGC
jgi:antirestriction protein